jgi:diguanylate cyclase (GGDEF)-like protein
MSEHHAKTPTHGNPHDAGTEEDLRRLGEALDSRVQDVLERTRTGGNGTTELEEHLEETLGRISASSTHAVARWMEGRSPEEGRDTSRWVFETYGQWAAERVIGLNDVTKRVLRWRDAVRSVLNESAEQLGIGEGTVLKAARMVQRTIDVTIVRMCECFEEERTRTDAQMAFMATHDTLTGLPNRTLLMDRAGQALLRSQRQQTPVAALFIDIDNFKGVNDTLGHDAGDELLKHITARLQGVVRATDALGRLGGDEFVVIAEGVSLDAGPELIAERLLEALGQPIDLKLPHASQLTVSASIGIAAGMRASPDELIRDADIAMYRAKQEGKHRFVVFEDDMHAAVQGRMSLEIALHEALAKDELFLVYQPTFDLDDMRPTGVEALLRWRHPERGVIQPGEFIPLMEETGLIVDVGAWVLWQACHQGAEWHRAGHGVGMAVNVSARQLDEDRLVGHVRHALRESGLPPEALTLEITETTLMRNAEATARRLSEIKELGVQIAIDDFGSGYSSLAYLQRFPVDALKIDRSFIAQLTHNPEGQTLIHTLIQLGKALSIQTLAEGIEQEPELSVLRGEECDSGQGFLYSKPLDVNETAQFLRERVGPTRKGPTPAGRSRRPSRRAGRRATGAPR